MHRKILSDDYLAAKRPINPKIKLTTMSAPKGYLQFPLNDKYENHISLLYLDFQSLRHPMCDIVVENIIVEYSPGVYQTGKKLEKVNKDTYLSENVSIGIPNKSFEWFMDSVKLVCELDLLKCHHTKSESHTWVVASLPFSDELKKECCQLFVKKTRSITKMGSLCEVVDTIKSNLIGYGQLNVYVIENFTCHYVSVEFVLSGFHLIDTEISGSYPENYSKLIPSENLVHMLEISYL